jgi:hypothetical protein
VKFIAQLRGWIGQSVSRRLAIPGLVLIVLLLVQAALSTGSAYRLVGRLEESSRLKFRLMNGYNSLNKPIFL